MILSDIPLEIQGFGLNEIIDLSIMGFSLVLFALSVSAYRSTKIKKIGFASAAFALFAIQLFLEYIEDVFTVFEDNLEIVLSIITLMILILFFFAVVKKR